MINKSNLGQYINFLHKKRKGHEASPELISQWSHVEKELVASELSKLYAFWQLSEDQINEYEQEFNNSISTIQNDFLAPQSARYPQQNHTPPVTTTSPPPQPAYVPPPQPHYNPVNGYPPAKKGLSTIAIIAIVLGVVVMVPAIGFGIYKVIQPKDSAKLVPQDTLNREVVVTPDAKAQVQTQEIKPTELIDERDVERKISHIRSLLKAEEHQHFSNIMDHFSPKIQRYWDLKNPSRDKMYEMYHKSWEKALDFTYRNVEVRRITNNLYEMTADYSYFSIKDDANKSLKIKNKYEFDDNGLIIKAYGSSQ